GRIGTGPECHLLHREPVGERAREAEQAGLEGARAARGRAWQPAHGRPRRRLSAGSIGGPPVVDAAMRRGRGTSGERAQGRQALNALNTPFAGLGKQLGALPKPAPPRPAPPRPAPRAEEPDLFAHAMEGVVPLPRERAARVDVDRFLADSVALGHRCVLIVHGRGHNSKDQTPVLKERLKSWLARGRTARIVLGFTTARPCDGGAGALYVLLRRDRRRRPIRVTEGAKI